MPFTALEPGARVTFADAGHGEILTVDPPHLFAFTWEEDHLRIELTPDGAGTTLTFEHGFTDRYGAASFATGWDTCLDALAATLDERPFTAPDTTEPHERYVDLLGLAEPEVRRTPEGWTLHAERQLVRPEAAARAALDRHGWTEPATRIDLTTGTGHGARIVVRRGRHRPGRPRRSPRPLAHPPAPPRHRAGLRRPLSPPRTHG